MRAGKGSGTDGGDYGKNAKCIPSQHWKNILNKVLFSALKCTAHQ